MPTKRHCSDVELHRSITSLPEETYLDNSHDVSDKHKEFRSANLGGLFRDGGDIHIPVLWYSGSWLMDLMEADQIKC